MLGIDEAQFFDDEIVRVCNDLANQGIRVIVAGLIWTLKEILWTHAGSYGYSRITKVHAVCTHWKSSEL
jgi:thymidine kinase